MGLGCEGTRIGEAAGWSRLILWRPRPEFLLPAEWADRAWIALGELRPLLQAVSPVRDLSDIWRWVAAPLPLADVEAALNAVAVFNATSYSREEGERERRLTLRMEDQAVRAVLVLASATGIVERVELAARGDAWLVLPTPTERAAILTIAAALRGACGLIAVAR